MNTLTRAPKRLNGTQTLGRGRVFWSSFAATAIVLTLVPAFAQSYVVNNLAYFLLWSLPLNGPIGTPGAANTPALRGTAGRRDAFLDLAGEFDKGSAQKT